MLSLEEIKNYFPGDVYNERISMIREYLQYKILEIIFQNDISSKLIFIGGTALRIAYNTQRFSEDLDFDNKGLTEEEWNSLGADLIYKLGLELQVEIDSRRNKTVFHHDLKFPGLQHRYEISGHKNQKLLIKVDSEDQKINYKYDLITISKFGIQIKIKVMPLDVALSQKIRAMMDREMGRDLFDISSIAPRTKPNYEYLEAALGIKTSIELKEKIIDRCKNFDFNSLEHRAKKFLFREQEINKVRDFLDFVKHHEF